MDNKYRKITGVLEKYILYTLIIIPEIFTYCSYGHMDLKNMDKK